MKYEEIRQYLKQNPYCFRTLREREEEMNNRIMEREGKIINFAKASKRYYDEDSHDLA
jgi:hypothetical protein